MTRRPHTDAERAEALAVYAEVGLAEAHRSTGIPKPTLHRWAVAAGLDTSEVVERSVERNRVAAQASAAARTYEAEAFRTEMVTQLAEVARKAVAKELEVLAQESPSLDKIVGARTRAIHDLQLLTGAATGRTELTERAPEVEAELARVLQMRRSA